MPGAVKGAGDTAVHKKSLHFHGVHIPEKRSLVYSSLPNLPEDSSFGSIFHITAYPEEGEEIQRTAEK